MMQALFGFTTKMQNMLMDDLRHARSKITRENVKYGLKYMAGFIKPKKAPVGRQIELEPTEL